MLFASAGPASSLPMSTEEQFHNKENGMEIIGVLGEACD